MKEQTFTYMSVPLRRDHLRQPNLFDPKKTVPLPKYALGEQLWVYDADDWQAYNGIEGTLVHYSMVRSLYTIRTRHGRELSFIEREIMKAEPERDYPVSLYYHEPGYTPNWQSLPSSRREADVPGLLPIDQQQLEAFRQSLPEGKRYEIFRFFVARWDIVRARYLIQRSGRAPDVLQVASAAKAYGLTTPQTRESPVSIDEQRAMSEHIDTDVPVILALLQGDEGTQPKPILIDGLHRLYKAYREEKITIPCFVLSSEEEHACRL